MMGCGKKMAALLQGLGLAMLMTCSTAQSLRYEKLSIDTDKYITISGTVGFLFDGDDTLCGESGVEVVAYNSSTGIEVARTSTDSSGTYALSGISVDSYLYLELSFSQHTFSPVDADYSDLFASPGRNVSESLSNVNIYDTTNSSFKFDAVATSCGFDIGDVDVVLTPGSCSSAWQRTVSKGDLVELPASTYDYTFTFYNESNAEDFFRYEFEQMSVVNLTNASLDWTLIYMPTPDLEITGVEGATLGPSNLSSCSNADYVIPSNGESLSVTGTASVSYYNDDLGTGGKCGIPTTFSLNLGITSPDTVLALGGSLYANGGSSMSDTCSSYSSQCQSSETRVSVGVDSYFAPPVESDTTLEDVSGLVSTLEVILNGTSTSIFSLTARASISVLQTGPALTYLDGSVFLYTAQWMQPLLYLYAPPAASGVSFASTAFQVPATITSELNAEMVNDTVGTSIESVSFTHFYEVFELNSGYDYSDTEASTTQWVEANATSESGDLGIFTTYPIHIFQYTQVTYDIDSCTASTSSPVGIWHNTGYLVNTTVMTRKECEDKLNSQMAIIQTATNETTLNAAKLMRDQLLNILRDWDQDKLDSYGYPVDVSALVSANTVPSESSEIVIDSSLSFQDSATTPTTASPMTMLYSQDRSSSPYVKLLSTDSATDSVTLQFVENDSNDADSYVAAYSLKTQILMTDSSGDPVTIAVDTYISFEQDDETGDSLCLMTYRSPRSGTLRYDVCGGQTQCSSSLDATTRESFVLQKLTTPDSVLSSDAGTFMFAIDTTAMNSSETLDVTVGLDLSMDSSGLISFTLNGETFSEDNTVSLEIPGGSEQTVVVTYTRGDTDLLSTSGLISVTSACSGGTSQTLPFTLNWVSSCPSIAWSGDLSEFGSTWTLTSQLPTLTLDYTLGSEDASSTTSLWAALYDGEGVAGEWFEISTSLETSSSLTIDAYSTNLESPKRYLFELRVTCSDGSETRSTRRLGIFDDTGPEMISWGQALSISASDVVPIAVFRFDEPIDCTAIELAASMTNSEGLIADIVNVSCSSSLMDLTVMLSLDDTVDASQWQDQLVTITLEGIQDLYGNAYTASEAWFRRRILSSEGISVDIQSLPWSTSSSSIRYLPTASAVSEMVAKAKANVLQGASAVTSAYYISSSDGDGDGSGSSSGLSKNNKIIIGVVIGVLAVAAVLGAAFFLMRRRANSTEPEDRIANQVNRDESDTGRLHIKSLNPSFHHGKANNDEP